MRSSSRWPTAATASTLLLILASKAIAVESATIIVNNGDEIQVRMDVSSGSPG